MADQPRPVFVVMGWAGDQWGDRLFACVLWGMIAFIPLAIVFGAILHLVNPEPKAEPQPKQIVRPVQQQPVQVNPVLVGGKAPNGPVGPVTDD